MRSTATAAERNRRRKGAPLRNARPTTARTTTPWRRFCCTSPPPAMPSLRGWTWTRSVRPRRLSRRPSRASRLPPLFLSPAAGRNNSPIVGPRLARARSLDPGTRSKDEGVAARSRSSEDCSVPRRARRFEPPTPRLAEAREESVTVFLGLRRCRRVDRGSSHVFLLKACLLRDPLILLLTSPPLGRVAVT